MVNTKECRAAGLEPAAVEKIARGLARYAKQADQLGLIVFSDGSLRYDDNGPGSLVVADGLGQNFGGGDGACNDRADGLLRGECA